MATAGDVLAVTEEVVTEVAVMTTPVVGMGGAM
jgi:hypothetical protein